MFSFQFLCCHGTATPSQEKADSGQNTDHVWHSSLKFDPRVTWESIQVNLYISIKQKRIIKLCQMCQTGGQLYSLSNIEYCGLNRNSSKSQYIHWTSYSLCSQCFIVPYGGRRFYQYEAPILLFRLCTLLVNCIFNINYFLREIDDFFFIKGMPIITKGTWNKQYESWHLRLNHNHFLSERYF